MLSIGTIFCRLTVIGPAPTKRSGNLCSWVRCSCGIKLTVSDSNLRTGNTRSCGCLQVDAQRVLAREKFTRHGFARMKAVMPTWRSWSSMRDRCTNAMHHAWDRYGGRGIKVCDRWLNSFEAFLEDVGERPGLAFSIDRIDPDGNYEPGNCRWADRVTQGRNRSTRLKK
jgi:hypothetical protein